jgi:hypothetical protein
MAWSRFGRYAGVRDAECAAFEDFRAEEGSEGSRGLCVVCKELRSVRCGRIGIGIGEGLECLVCTETVT